MSNVNDEYVNLYNHKPLRSTYKAWTSHHTGQTRRRSGREGKGSAKGMKGQGRERQGRAGKGISAGGVVQV